MEGEKAKIEMGGSFGDHMTEITKAIEAGGEHHWQDSMHRAFGDVGRVLEVMQMAKDTIAQPGMSADGAERMRGILRYFEKNMKQRSDAYNVAEAGRSHEAMQVARYEMLRVVGETELRIKDLQISLRNEHRRKVEELKDAAFAESSQGTH